MAGPQDAGHANLLEFWRGRFQRQPLIAMVGSGIGRERTVGFRWQAGKADKAKNEGCGDFRLKAAYGHSSTRSPKSWAGDKDELAIFTE